MAISIDVRRSSSGSYRNKPGMNARSASLRTGMAVCPHSALAEGPAACFVGAPAREERQAPQEAQQPQFPPQPGRPLFLSRRSTAAAAPAARRHSPNRTRIVLIASFPLSVLCSDLCRDRFGQPGRFMIRAEEQISSPAIRMTAAISPPIWMLPVKASPS